MWSSYKTSDSFLRLPKVGGKEITGNSSLIE